MHAPNPDISCENRLCLYWRAGCCVLRDIALDRFGHCLECTPLPVADEVLEEGRRALFAQFSCDVYHRFADSEER